MEQERPTPTSELINQFYVTEGNPEIGRELSIRLFDHAGFTDNPNTTPLMGRDGEQIQQDGKPLFLSDYVNFAVTHHFDAVESILDFLREPAGTRNYETVRQSILGRLRTDQA